MAGFRIRSAWHLLALAAVLLAQGCAVIEETWLASDPLEGQQPRLVRATFRGNAAVADHVLRAVIRPDMMGLSRGLDPQAAAYDAADAIAAHYRGIGHPDVEVDYQVHGPERRAGEPDAYTVAFGIREGPEVTVAAMTLEGNRLCDDDTLLDLWTRTNSGTFGTGDPLYVRAELEDFAAAIRTFYWRRGHWAVVVQGPRIERQPGARSVRVRIAITEGPEYRFGRVEVEPALVAALGEDMPASPAGEVFTTRRLQEFLLAIRARLRRSGYPDPVVKIPPLGDLSSLPQPVVDLRVVGDPGPRVRYGEIRIEGLDRTAESVVRRELGVECGELFDGSREEDGLARLYRTGLFKTVRIEHGEPENGVLPLTVQLEELDARAVEFLLGYGSYERARAGVRYEDRNLFGRGHVLSLEGRVSQRGFRTAALYSDPAFLDSGIEWSLGGELYRREQPSFTDEALGGTTAFRGRLPGGAIGRLGASYVQHRNADIEAIDPAAALTDYDIGMVFAELRRDRRDNFLAPKSGWHGYFRGDFADRALASDVDLWRLRAGGSAVLPLGENTRVVLRGEAGWLFPRDGSLIPLPERFFNGGYDTVRSFRQSELGPKDINGEALGGEYRNVLNLELRQQLIGPLEGSLFADAGNVGSAVEDYGLAGLRYGLGAGLRLQLPIGPVRFDAAYNPDRRPGEEVWVFHLAIGYPF